MFEGSSFLFRPVEAISLSQIAVTLWVTCPGSQVHEEFGRESTAAYLQLIGTAHWKSGSVRDECIMQSPHQMTLLEELQARLLAKFGSGTECVPAAVQISEAMSSRDEEPVFAWSSIAPKPLETFKSRGE